MAQPYSGYRQAAAQREDEQLTHVLPHTPCGELMRRYWQPVVQASMVPADRPLVVRLLGEDLVLFRDGGGRLGLLHVQCCHRQSSLEYGIVSQRGIRCCYHGWLFDVDGTILETPAEPPNSRIKDSVSQGAYPVREYKGLVFAYLGPPDEKPEFPVFDTFDQPDTEMLPYSYDYPCNWLQCAENVIDPYHTVFLHTRVSGTQFSDAFGELPVVVWREMPSGAGIYLFNVRRVKNHLWIRIQESFRPNFSQTGDIWQEAGREKVFCRVGLSKWIVPLDNSNCRIIGWRYFSDMLDLGRHGDRSRVGRNLIDFPGQLPNREHESRQRQPGDFEAIVSQGPIAVHAKEHLAASDIGVAMVRNKLRQAFKQTENGERPPLPRRNADGVFASYTQDTVLHVPPSGDDDALRRELGVILADIVVATDRLPAAQRRAAIRARILEILAPRFPTIRLDEAAQAVEPAGA